MHVRQYRAILSTPSTSHECVPVQGQHLVLHLVCSPMFSAIWTVSANDWLAAEVVVYLLVQHGIAAAGVNAPWSCERSRSISI